MSILFQVGGLALKKPDPLPSDLQEFMDSATDGAVLVSFGSSLRWEETTLSVPVYDSNGRPDQMPEEKVALFIEAFKKLGMKVCGFPRLVLYL